jgi:hypothetical protein
VGYIVLIYGNVTMKPPVQLLYTNKKVKKEEAKEISVSLLQCKEIVRRWLAVRDPSLETDQADTLILDFQNCKK